MTEFIKSLEHRYQAVLKSSSDPRFYLNVHAYIDFIIKTPKLAEIMDDSERKYNREHSEIWAIRKHTDDEIDEQADYTWKYERFNLFASNYVTLLMRIYWPIEEYKTTNEPDYAQDSVALLMIKGGIKNIPRERWSRMLNRPDNRWAKKNLESYNRWFEGKRKDYEDELTQFHFDFLNVVENIKDSEIKQPIKKEKSVEKIVIVIDNKEGIYRQDNKKLCYEIEYGSKRQELISYLFHKNRASISDIETETNREGKRELIMKEIREINDLFWNKLDVNEDLIFTIPTGGYCLNKDKFDIRMNPKNL